MSNSNIDRARAWLRNTPGAISGQGGHNATFAVATALVHGFELSHGDAETLLHEYNAKCMPPWKPNDLVHKLNEAFRVFSRQAERVASIRTKRNSRINDRQVRRSEDPSNSATGMPVYNHRLPQSLLRTG
jgi:hypothetical protein